MNSIFKKIDLIMDRAMDYKWFRALIFAALIINAIVAILGSIAIAILFN